MFLNSPRRALILVKVEPLRSKNTLGFQRATSAAHSYSGLPQGAPSTGSLGRRRAISSRSKARIREEAACTSQSKSFRTPIRGWIGVDYTHPLENRDGML